MLQLIAAYAVADYPLTLYLSDGLIYHRVILNSKHLAYWQDLNPREALYYMVTDLKKVGARPFPAAHDACHVAQSKENAAGLHWAGLCYPCCGCSLAGPRFRAAHAGRPPA